MKQIYFLCLMSIALILSINSQSSDPSSSAPEPVNLMKKKFTETTRRTMKTVSTPAIPIKKTNYTTEERAEGLKHFPIRFLDDMRTISRHFYSAALCMWKDLVRKRQNKERECVDTCIQRFAVRLEDDSTLCPHADIFLQVLRDGMKRIRRYNNLSKTKGIEIIKKALNEKRKVFWDIWEMLGTCRLVPDRIRKRAEKNIKILKDLMNCPKKRKDSFKEKLNGKDTAGSRNITAPLSNTQSAQPGSEPVKKSRKQKAIEGKFYVRQLKLKKFFKKMKKLIIIKISLIGGVPECKENTRMVERLALKKSAKLIALLLAKISYLSPYGKRTAKKM